MLARRILPGATAGLLAALALTAAACSDAKDDAGGGGEAAAQDGGVAASSDGGGGAGGAGGGAAESVCPVVGFTACGGALAGVWDIVEWCPDSAEAAAALCQHPFDGFAECKTPANRATCHTRLSGTVRFTEPDEGTTAGSFTLARSSAVDSTYTFDGACLAASMRGGGAPDALCGVLDAREHLACTWDGALCTCTATVTEAELSDRPAETSTAPWTRVSPGRVRVDLGDHESFEADYCVKDDLLTLDVMPHLVSWRYWVQRRHVEP